MKANSAWIFNFKFTFHQSSLDVFTLGDIDKNKESIEASQKAIQDVIEKLEQLHKTFDEVKERDIDDLIEAKAQTEAKIKVLEDEAKALDEKIQVCQSLFSKLATLISGPNTIRTSNFCLNYSRLSITISLQLSKSAKPRKK